MSVAVSRPQNVSMNSNIASRSGLSASSSTIRARPSGSTGGNGNINSGNNSLSGKISIPSRPAMTSRASSVSTSTVTSIQAPVASGSGSKDTSSSAGKVFAKPSKEWVLPERAKPGRKVSADEPDNKRQSQNRLSQRAHRARRTDYITTLEDRLRQYEADEIHSNVRLQEVARALKIDNEKMKNELMLIRGKMNEVYAEKEGWDVERRNLEEMCAGLMSEVERLRASTGSGLKLEPSSASSSSLPRQSRPVAASVRYPVPSTSSNDGPKRTPVACPICPDPDPDCPCQQPVPAESPIPVAVPHQSDCGLCTTPAECLCRVIADDPSPAPITQGKAGKAKCDVCPSLAICLCEDDSPPPLPRTSAAVPLSLRSKSRGPGIDKPKQTFWRLDNVVTKGEAVCSGDPSNCDACRDDSFGKEFCGHLFEAPSTATTYPGQIQPASHIKKCIDCPGNCMSIQNLVTPTNEGFSVQPPTPSPSPEEQTEETMRCDEAWKKLKAHPNAKFASLALLADVVAGRTKCTGPAIELSPVPTHTPSPLAPARTSTIGVGVGIGSTSPLSKSTLHTQAHVAANVHAIPASGAKRRMGVETSAVRDALRLLDSTPSRATSELVHVKTEPIDLDDVNERATKKVRLE